MKLKVSKIVPKGFTAITLWPFGIYFAKDLYMNNTRILNHEKIHWEQQKEMLGIVFYLWYGIEYLLRRINNSADGAYRDICFEKEAFANHHYSNYLEVRKRYVWIKYLK